MKDFILSIIAGIIIVTGSMIAFYQWEKRIAYGKEYMELRQEVNRIDRGLMELEIRANEMDKTIVAYWRYQKRR